MLTESTLLQLLHSGTVSATFSHSRSDFTFSPQIFFVLVIQVMFGGMLLGAVNSTPLGRRLARPLIDGRSEQRLVSQNLRSCLMSVITRVLTGNATHYEASQVMVVIPSFSARSLAMACDTSSSFSL